MVAERSSSDDADLTYSDERLPLSALRVDTTYQRPPSWERIHRWALGYNTGAAEPIRVNRRPDGTVYIIDGQHRAKAAEMAGRTEIRCQVYSMDAVADEARWFYSWNDTRHLDVRDRFRSQLAYGDTGAVAIKVIAEECGFTLALSPHGIRAPGTTGCVDFLSAIYTRPGGEVQLRRILSLTRKTWPDRTRPDLPAVGAGAVVILKVMDRWFRRYDGHFDEGRFVAAVGTDPNTSDPKRLSRLSVAQQDDGLSPAQAALLLLWKAYNWKLRQHRLPHPYGHDVVEDETD